ncbi:PAS domain-containing hybrid sensor histidine kinase/response regulator [Actinoplanes xinjiangensis]|uniref:PAS domain-containing hybrid sensor histidine kinase/response regulator n=1 Tax=Actinoplanes xinjiangensis TaxID=512350 RepID=UPI00341FC6E5
MQPEDAAAKVLEFPAGAVRFDGDGYITAVSADAERLLAYQPGELVGKPVGVLVSDEAVLSGSVGVEAVCSVFGAETGVRCRRKDGTRFMATATISRLEATDGGGIHMTIHPLITPAGKGRAHPLLEALIDSADEAIAVAGRDGTILLWNPAAERMLGYRASEVVGFDRSMAAADLDARLGDELFERVSRGEHLTLDGHHWRAKNGHIVTSDTRIWPLRGSAGEIVGVVWFRRDISEGHRTAAIIRAMVQGMSIPVLAVDETGTIRVLNPAMERLFGYAAAELLGQPVEVLVPVALRDIHDGHLRGFMQQPHTRHMGEGRSLRGLRKDGTSFPVEISLSPFPTDEGLLVTAAVADITERLRMEEHRTRWTHEVQVTRRMESLGQLAGGVAHNFNNLLGVILGNVSFLEDELIALNERDADRPLAGPLLDVQQIKNAAERAARQTQQLLAFGRRDTVQPRPVDLNDVVTAMHGLLDTTLGPQIRMITVRGQALRQIMADPGELEQVLMNLAINARDAMSGDGTLRVETDNLTVDELYADSRGISTGQYVRLRVSDTGAGMTPDVAERAFEPFYTTRSLSEAQGLGLTTVYAIVTTAGGHVAIHSGPGHGTTVTVLLPALDRTQAPAATETAPPVDPAGSTLLVVDDEAAIRDIAARMLTQAGYTVLLAEHGPAALALAARHPAPIDLLLTDLVMPDMNGKELAQQLQHVRPELAVVFMSGYPQPILTASGDLDTDAVVLQKPFTKNGILTAVADTLIRARGR